MQVTLLYNEPTRHVTSFTSSYEQVCCFFRLFQKKIHTLVYKYNLLHANSRIHTHTHTQCFLCVGVVNNSFSASETISQRSSIKHYHLSFMARLPSSAGPRPALGKPAHPLLTHFLPGSHFPRTMKLFFPRVPKGAFQKTLFNHSSQQYNILKVAQYSGSRVR